MGPLFLRGCSPLNYSTFYLPLGTHQTNSAGPTGPQVHTNTTHSAVSTDFFTPFTAETLNDPQTFTKRPLEKSHLDMHSLGKETIRAGD